MYGECVFGDGGIVSHTHFCPLVYIGDNRFDTYCVQLVYSLFLVACVIENNILFLGELRSPPAETLFLPSFFPKSSTFCQAFFQEALLSWIIPELPLSMVI